MRFRRSYLVVLVLVACFVSILSHPSHAFDPRRLFRRTAQTLGIQALVRAFAEPLDDFVNTLLINNEVENREQTKVVPIISFGDRTAVGAAQVSGSDEALARVRSVMRYDDIFSEGRFGVGALVPGDSTDPTRFSRVYGCGVTAVIDVTL